MIHESILSEIHELSLLFLPCGFDEEPLELLNTRVVGFAVGFESTAPTATAVNDPWRVTGVP